MPRPLHGPESALARAGRGKQRASEGGTLPLEALRHAKSRGESHRDCTLPVVSGILMNTAGFVTVFVILFVHLDIEAHPSSHNASHEVGQRYTGKLR